MSVFKLALSVAGLIVLLLAALKFGAVEKIRTKIDAVRERINRHIRRLKWKVVIWELNRRNGD